MRDTAPYNLVSRFEDADFALKTEDMPVLTDADAAGFDQFFELLASQSNTRSESSFFIANTHDPFSQEDAQERHPVSQDDGDPLTANSAVGPASRRSSNGGEPILSNPPNNSAASNPPNLAGPYTGAGQGPGGVSTPNPSGGGPSGGGGSANLHLPSPTQVQQTPSGANSQTASAAPPVSSNAALGTPQHALPTVGSGSGTGSNGTGTSGS